MSVPVNGMQVTRIGDVAWEVLARPWLRPQVFALFDRVVYLNSEDGDASGLIALVHPEIGSGPLNLVVSPWDALKAAVTTATPVSLAAGALRLGAVALPLVPAAVWSSRISPLAAMPAAELCRRLMPALQAPTYSSDWLGEVCAGHAGARVLPAAALDLLEGGLRHAEATKLTAGAAQLAGLGIGLTPSGDDFLCGVMTGLWLLNPSRAGEQCAALLAGAYGGTTSLSAAFLRCAAQGRVNEPWLGLRAVLPGADGGAIRQAVTTIMTHGHTSGADTLAGLLWLSQTLAQPVS